MIMHGYNQSIDRFDDSKNGHFLSVRSADGPITNKKQSLPDTETTAVFAPLYLESGLDHVAVDLQHLLSVLFPH